MSQSDLILHDNIIKIEASQINKNNWNPNFVPKKIMDSIIDDIKQNGFIGSIIVQRYNKKMQKPYVIINGEHRFDALTKVFKATEIPCTVLDCTDKQAKVLSIRLNREHGELAPDRLASLLQDLNEEDEFENLRQLTAIEDQELKLYLNLDIDNVFATEEETEEMVDTIEKEAEKQTKQQQNSKTSEQQNNNNNNTKLSKRDTNKYFYIEWDEFFGFVRTLAEKVKRDYKEANFDYIYAIPTGGTVGGHLLSKMLGIPLLPDIDNLNRVNLNILIYDEIYDTGKTFIEYYDKVNYGKIAETSLSAKFCFATMRAGNGVNKMKDEDRMRDIAGIGTLIDTEKYIVFPYDVYGLDDEPLLDR